MIIGVKMPSKFAFPALIYVLFALNNTIASHNAYCSDNDQFILVEITGTVSNEADVNLIELGCC